MDARNILQTSLALLIKVAFMSIAHAQDFTFDSDVPGAPPAGWRQGVTGAGVANWAVAADDAAPSPPHVLLQTGVGACPWIARANALENNVSLYDKQAGRGNTLKHVDAPVLRDQWHRLRVDFGGTRMRVSPSGRNDIEHESGHIAGPGGVGLWTEADSVSAFDDSSCRPSQGPGR